MRCKSETFAHTEDMRINRHRRLVPYNRTNDIRGLATYPLQRLQIFDSIGNFTMINLHEALRHLHQMF